MDRAFIEHVVGCLVQAGTEEIDFVLSHAAGRFEELLRDGRRWHARFRNHLARNADRPYDLLKIIASSLPEEPLLLGHGDRLPLFEPDSFRSWSNRTAPVLFCWRPNRCANDSPPTLPGLRGDEGLLWTGWSRLARKDLEDLPSRLDEAGLERYLSSRRDCEIEAVEVGEPLSVVSYTHYLRSQRRVLNAGFHGVSPAAGLREGGVLLGPGCILHPNARLVPPVAIGPETQIENGAQIGPNAAIGGNCILKNRCRIRDAAVLAGSVVGEAIELQDVIVDRNRVINIRLAADLTVVDRFLPGSRPEPRLRSVMTNLKRVLFRLGAWIILIIHWPLMVFAFAGLVYERRKPRFYGKEVVRLPVPAERSQWRTYRLVCLTEPPPGTDSRWGHFF